MLYRNPCFNGGPQLLKDSQPSGLHGGVSINKSRFRYILGSDLPRAFSYLVCFALVEDPNYEYLISEKMRVVDTLTVHPSTSARLNSNASIIMTMLYGESRTPAGSTPPHESISIIEV